MKAIALILGVAAFAGCASHNKSEELYWKGFDDGLNVSHKNLDAQHNQSELENAE